MTDIRTNNGLIESFLAQRFQVQENRPLPQIPRQQRTTTDIVSISRSSEQTSFLQDIPVGGSRLIREITEVIERGFRRTQEFQNTDGRSFTRVEEFTQTSQGFRRVIEQENPSGNSTLLEETLNLIDNGDNRFLRTQIFRDESGDTSTQITENFESRDPFVLSGGRLPNTPANDSSSPFNILRGTQLDIQT